MKDRDSGGQTPDEIERAVMEDAIAVWEKDKTRNPDSLKVVRGSDGNPVEVIVKDEEHAAFIVNGQERAQFELIRLLDIKKPTDPIPSLCLDGVLKEGYFINAYKHIPFGTRGIDTLIGVPMGTPPGLFVTK